MQRPISLHIGLLITWLMAALASRVEADPQVLTAKMHHLRQGSVREWSDFPEQAERDHLRLEFQLGQPPQDACLRLRQRNVKQPWDVTLNGKKINRLERNENDTVAFIPLPRGALRAGMNVLEILFKGKTADDVEIGEVSLLDRPLEEVLNEARLEITVTDEATKAGLPCRITLVDEHGSLVTVAASPAPSLAVRPGVVYTSDGRASISLPAGKYTLYAGRGFEYSVSSTTLDLKVSENAKRQLTVRREVPTPGLVSCDTHCHTFSYSRHGDASLAERMVTLAGEGIELPVATDHNLVVDYRPQQQAAGLDRYFTPLIGDEDTTPVGHFNVFPLAADSTPIDFHGRDWATVFSAIRERSAPAIIVLNHARDLHSGFRPFDPARHISIAGEDLEGWKLEANAMEIVNSGATLNDPLELPRDWFGLLNRGLHVAPVGSSDSHDVARYIVGQGRTYIQCPDDEPGKIDAALACKHFAQGRISVSLGLLAGIIVNDRYLPGDLAPAAKCCQVQVRVLGPSWTQADRVILYANGREIRSESVPSDDPRRRLGGIKYEVTWQLDDLPHDTWLVAVALGPGVTAPYWPIARPYQPTSPDWTPYVLAVTGAVRLDRDGDGQFRSAYGYAQQAIQRADDSLSKLLSDLAHYDEATSTQAASLLRQSGTDLMGAALSGLLKQAAPAVQRGFRAYLAAWRQSLDARAAQPHPK